VRISVHEGHASILFAMGSVLLVGYSYLKRLMEEAPLSSKSRGSVNINTLQQEKPCGVGQWIARHLECYLCLPKNSF
jgi:hypothetical protein